MSETQDRFCKLPSGISLCYRTHGDSNGVPLLLVAGLGQQLISWPATLVDALTNNGFFVITFDNRDVGRSDRIHERPPGMLQQLLRRPGEGYNLGDMAADTAGLLNGLGVDAAHLVGMSMGGMIAQTVAARYPQHTLSLTSIFSTTGAPKVGQPTMGSMLRLVKPPARNRRQSIARFTAMVRHIGPTAYDVTDAELRDYAGQAWDRGLGPRDASGVGRQIGAIMRSGDRTEEVRKIKAPTLVIHGHRDPLVHPSGGKATARAIRNAKLITLHGMGHYLPEGVLPELADLISGHAQRNTPLNPQRRPILHSA